jgi:hypothetical protein
MKTATVVRMTNVQNVILDFIWKVNFASLVMDYALNVAVLWLARSVNLMYHTLILTENVSACLVFSLTALGLVACHVAKSTLTVKAALAVFVPNVN